MISRRQSAIIAIALGFGITGFAGFFLAISNQPVNVLLVRALIVFIVVLPFFGFGVYYYVNTTQAEPLVSKTEMQRTMLDMLRERGRLSFHELAAELNISEGEVNTLIQDLDSLDLFSGTVDWSTGMVYSERPDELPDGT